MDSLLSTDSSEPNKRTRFFSKLRRTDAILGVAACIIVTLAIVGICVIIGDLTHQYFPNNDNNNEDDETPCDLDIIDAPNCLHETPMYRIVETIPPGVNLPSPFQNTSDAWFAMLRGARSSIQIGCSYFTLNQTLAEGDNSTWVDYGHEIGRAMYQEIINAANRGVKVQIVLNAPGSYDTTALQLGGYAEVRTVNFTELAPGYGILHAKIIIVDNSTFYLGSANLDWRALSQVKEVGIVFSNSTCLANDLKQIFEMYWAMGEIDVIPEVEVEVETIEATYLPECDAVLVNNQSHSFQQAAWPYYYQAFFNSSAPAVLPISTVPIPELNITSQITSTSMFLTSIPEILCPPYRSDDLLSSLEIINNEDSFLCLCVMDYAPITFYASTTQYWDILDSAFRKAAIERGVNVRIMVSKWSYGSDRALPYLLSLDALPNIEVNYLEIPDIPGVTIPYSRVNHAKYLISSTSSSITTSNWSADYFLSTAGVSYISNSTDILNQLLYIFNRDWDSSYSSSVTTWISSSPTPSPQP